MSKRTKKFDRSVRSSRVRFVCHVNAEQNPLLVKILSFVSMPRSRATIQIQIYKRPTWPIRTQNDPTSRKICVAGVCLCCRDTRLRIAARIHRPTLRITALVTVSSRKKERRNYRKRVQIRMLVETILRRFKARTFKDSKIF